ncbi:trimeric intracellular cation channel family protein [Pseudahrensia aquimaris]|uniref:Trimeric intracellular cation channel family protein n=1 Tax=Pseudahrensia aquimaris TaxID=744461 RepID=A0ABW3FE44_9HYPH
MESFLPTLAQLGTAVFAVSGALAGLRNRLDIVGVTFVATLTGIGGGTARDLLLGDTPLAWIKDPTDLFICIAIAILVATLNKPLLGRRLAGLYFADALGLALFAVLGAAKAETLNAHPFICVLLGAMTASFGGIIRDVVCNDTPVFLQEEIYITAALAGAALYIILPQSIGFELRASAGFVFAFALRMLAIRYNWSLPFPRYDDEQR